MDVWNAIVVIVRRWYITVPVLVLTAVVAVNAGQRVDPTYSSSATATLIGVAAPAPTPQEGVDPRDVVASQPQPALGLAASAQALSISMSSGEARGVAQTLGLQPDYTVRALERAAILVVRNEAPSLEMGLATTQYLLDDIEARLAASPELFGVQSLSHYELRVLAEPALVEQLFEGRLRIQGVAVAIGVIIAVALAFAAEGLGELRRRRRVRPAPAGPDRATVGRGDGTARLLEGPAEVADRMPGSTGNQPVSGQAAAAGRMSGPDQV